MPAVDVRLGQLRQLPALVVEVAQEACGFGDFILGALCRSRAGVTGRPAPPQSGQHVPGSESTKRPAIAVVMQAGHLTVDGAFEQCELGVALWQGAPRHQQLP